MQLFCRTRYFPGARSHPPLLRRHESFPVISRILSPRITAPNRDLPDDKPIKPKPNREDTPMQLTYRGTTYTQAPATVTITPSAIGKYRGTPFPIHTATVTPFQRSVPLTYRGVTYWGNMPNAAVPLTVQAETTLNADWAMA